MILAIFTVLLCKGYSQSYDPLHKPNTFRNKDNPYYWANSKPYEGYWQQDVHYSLKITLDEKNDRIDGKEELVYWNNSPDELEYVYFHLYQNAYKPGTYYDSKTRAGGDKYTYGDSDDLKKGTVIDKITVNGKQVKTEQDNTILKVFLPEPLKSGDSVRFDVDFKTYFGKDPPWRRMRVYDVHGYKHYNVTHFYPRITVYDRKFGWTTDQHLGKEFYGDFGTYDAEITLANNFILDGTGYLVNRSEMLPDTLRKKLDISNFKNKPWESDPSVIIPYDSTKTKTWIFHAENVHDFAFTADPTYRIGEVEWNGIKAYALAQESHAIGWQDAALLAMAIVKTYSEDIGMYRYHKMIVADANSGMEYPMLTLDGGFSPYYMYVFSHEIGHNWFFGQVGSNETYRAVLDEGFTQFLTVWFLEKFDKKVPDWGISPSAGYIDRYRKHFSSRYENSYYSYLHDAIRNESPRLNQHSDYFKSYYEYRNVYHKGTTMLYNLQYVLGDSLFLDAMKHYFEKWKFCHPYPEDMRQAFSEAAGTDLNWFFDQWLTSSEIIDYSVAGVKRINKQDDHIIKFKRKGGMQMPVDFTVTSRYDSTYSYHIPNTWFVKNTDATILPKWTGWNKLNPVYKARVNIPGGIRDIRIDTTLRLADVNLLNSSKKLPVKIYFDSQVKNLPEWDTYEVYFRPDLWYNGFDGIKVGAHMNGNYMDYRHKFNVSIWFNPGLLTNQFIDDHYLNQNDILSFRFEYSTPADRISRKSNINFSVKSLDGLHACIIGADKKWDRNRNELYFYIKSMYRKDSTDLIYLLYPDEWETGRYNNTINLGVARKFRYGSGNCNIDLHLRSATLLSDYDYSFITLSAINRLKISKLGFGTRIIMQYGTGTDIPRESALYLAGANPEEMMDNKYTRAIGFFDNNWDNNYDNNWIGHGEALQGFHHGGGLNLRGYSGYLVVEEVMDNKYIFAYKGYSGIAANAEMEFGRLVNPLPKSVRRWLGFDMYLFGDAGVININSVNKDIVFCDLRVDAGIGAALTVKKWGPLQKVKPLTIRFDAPVFLNRPPAEQEYLQFRWVVGVNRAF